MVRRVARLWVITLASTHFCSGNLPNAVFDDTLQIWQKDVFRRKEWKGQKPFRPLGNRRALEDTEVIKMQCIERAKFTGAQCECLAGFVPSEEACVCPSGQYLKDGICTTCPTGTAKANVGNSLSACEACKIGSKASQDGSSCECLAEFVLDGQACSCPKGKYLDDGSCVECPAGTAKASAGNGLEACLACPAGSETSKDGSLCVCPTLGHVIKDGRCVCDSDHPGPGAAPEVASQGGRALFAVPSLEKSPIFVSAKHLFDFTSSNISRLEVRPKGGEYSSSINTESERGDTDIIFGTYEDAPVTEFVARATDDCNKRAEINVTILFFEASVLSVAESVITGQQFEATFSHNFPVSSGYDVGATLLAATQGDYQTAVMGSVCCGASVSEKWSVAYQWGGRKIRALARLVVQDSISGQKAVVLATDNEDPGGLLRSSQEVSIVSNLRFVPGLWGSCSTDGFGRDFGSCASSLGLSVREVFCEYWSASSRSWSRISKSILKEAGIDAYLPLCTLAGLAKPATERECLPSECRRWEFTEWSSCSAQNCGVLGTQSRSAQCISGVTQKPMVGATSCNGIIVDDLELERSCNFGACSPTRISRSVEGECISNVTFCEDSHTGRLLENSACPEAIGDDGTSGSEREATCSSGTWSECSDSCNGITTRQVQDGVIEKRQCNSHASCDPPTIRVFSAASVAQCIDPGFLPVPCPEEGDFEPCETLCEPEVGRRLLSSGATSGLGRALFCNGDDSMRVATNGTCCAAGEALDRQGKCCSSDAIDACGVCGGGANHVDLYGRCCEGLDAMGYCCDHVDELGVCNGTAFGKASEPACGNGVCEIGEMCSTSHSASEQCCPADCPFQLHSCPVDPETNLTCSGAGRCLAATGQCDCYYSSGRLPGHDFSCALTVGGCRHGFTATPQGCVETALVQAYLCSNGQHDTGYEDGADCGGVCSTACLGDTEPPTLQPPSRRPTIPAPTAQEAAMPVGGMAVLITLGALLVIGCGCTGQQCFEFCCTKSGKRAKLTPGPGDGEPQSVNKQVFNDEEAELVEEAKAEAAAIAERKRAARARQKTDARLAELHLREELLATDVVMESWLIKCGKNKKVYGVLKPIGDLLLYKDMIPSGFGNVHIHLYKTVNLRDAIEVKLGGPEDAVSISKDNDKSGKESKRSTRTLHICCRAAPGSNAQKVRSFVAPDDALATEWHTKMRCLVNMFNEQARLPKKFRDEDMLQGRSSPPSPRAAPTALENDEDDDAEGAWSLLDVPPAPSASSQRSPAIPGMITDGDDAEAERAIEERRRQQREKLSPPNSSSKSLRELVRNSEPPPVAPPAPEPPALPASTRPRGRSRSKSKGSRRRLGSHASSSLPDDDAARGSSVPPPVPPFNEKDHEYRGKSASLSPAMRRRSASSKNESEPCSDPGFEQNKVIWAKFQRQI